MTGMNVGTRRSRTQAGDGMLDDFSPWMAARLRRGYNLPWPTLVLMSVFPDREGTDLAVPLTETEDRAVVEALFGLLTEFLEIPPVAP
ncbi:hypothetical protein [Streptomyces sp. PTD5-9]|uniref:hypothetical protein n=1 Tax=Streptomyces sp. PTD5-9 TaxID=3120150 RepID=UPI00300B6C67